MILIIGGAYQGKLDYAKNTFGISDEQVHTCTGAEIDFSKRCIYRLEAFTQAQPDATAYFQANRQCWQDSVLICQDISAGVVPLGEEMRLWRQNNGRLLQYLSREANQVIRIFCGLGQRLK
ncbi:MAG: bifunctional adenosylcobinamide kinase/adenosylcobinamide-phosphate guanylyltransferase [Oscillospiraceae bacterium]|nr:bifunctional adenosylcobinamide kinase/adenosylcobinamide-phosphate guanylyltransferase [Oscillospiraceae bacterium]